MGVKTMTTIFSALRKKGEVSATSGTQWIERTIAKQAIKMVRIGPFVAGKIGATAVAEKMGR